jgi:hypothetical protein
LSLIDLGKLGHVFTRPPLVIGGVAMQWHGLRPAGADVDLVAPAADVEALLHRFPDRAKNLWGDLGVCPFDFEIWKTICSYDYDELSVGAIPSGEVLVAGLETMMRLQAFASTQPKGRSDLDLIVRRILDDRYASARPALDAANERLLAGVPGVSWLEMTGPDP